MALLRLQRHRTAAGQRQPEINHAASRSDWFLMTGAAGRASVTGLCISEAIHMTRLYGQIVTLLWFTRESYDGALRLFAPGHSLPTHFEEWLSGAEQREQQLHRAGHATARMDMDCDVFLEYCRVKNAPVDYASCNKWARDVVADSTKANLPDYRHPSFRHGALRRR